MSNPFYEEYQKFISTAGRGIGLRALFQTWASNLLRRMQASKIGKVGLYCI